MKKPLHGSLAHFLLFTCLLAGFASSVTDTYTTLNCAFSSPSHTISAKATYYSGNVPTCVTSTMTLVATLPNATKVSYGPGSCTAGVHQFSIAAPVNGVYTLNASVAGTTASCSTAALFFTPRTRLPETDWAIVILTGFAAVALARRKRS